MNDCIFCKIIRGEIPSKKAYEDESVLAFYDIAPQAPVHILVVPKKHTDSAMSITAEDEKLLAHLFEVIQIVAKDNKIEEGFRIISNIGEQGGQTVKHLHFHVIGGKQLSDKMA